MVHLQTIRKIKKVISRITTPKKTTTVTKTPTVSRGVLVTDISAAGGGGAIVTKTTGGRVTSRTFVSGGGAGGGSRTPTTTVTAIPAARVEAAMAQVRAAVPLQRTPITAERARAITGGQARLLTRVERQSQASFAARTIVPTVAPVKQRRTPLQRVGGGFTRVGGLISDVAQSQFLGPASLFIGAAVAESGRATEARSVRVRGALAPRLGDVIGVSLGPSPQLRRGQLAGLVELRGIREESQRTKDIAKERDKDIKNIESKILPALDRNAERTDKLNALIATAEISGISDSERAKIVSQQKDIAAARKEIISKAKSELGISLKDDGTFTSKSLKADIASPAVKQLAFVKEQGGSVAGRITARVASEAALFTTIGVAGGAAIGATGLSGLTAGVTKATAVKFAVGSGLTSVGALTGSVFAERAGRRKLATGLRITGGVAALGAFGAVGALGTVPTIIETGAVTLGFSTLGGIKSFREGQPRGVGTESAILGAAIPAVRIGGLVLGASPTLRPIKIRSIDVGAGQRTTVVAFDPVVTKGGKGVVILASKTPRSVALTSKVIKGVPTITGVKATGTTFQLGLPKGFKFVPTKLAVGTTGFTPSGNVETKLFTTSLRNINVDQARFVSGNIRLLGITSKAKAPVLSQDVLGQSKVFKSLPPRAQAELAKVFREQSGFKLTLKGVQPGSKVFGSTTTKAQLPKFRAAKDIDIQFFGGSTEKKTALFTKALKKAGVQFQVDPKSPGQVLVKNPLTKGFDKLLDVHAGDTLSQGAVADPFGFRTQQPIRIGALKASSLGQEGVSKFASIASQQPTGQLGPNLVKRSKDISDFIVIQKGLISTLKGQEKVLATAELAKSQAFLTKVFGAKH